MITIVVSIFLGALFSFAQEAANSNGNNLLDLVHSAQQHAEPARSCKKTDSNVQTIAVRRITSGFLTLKGNVRDLVAEVDKAIAANMVEAKASWKCEAPCSSIIQPERVIRSFPTQSEETWLPDSDSKCTSEHINKSSRVVNNDIKIALTEKELREKDNSTLYQKCKVQLEEKVSGWAKEALLSQINVVIEGKTQKRLNQVCPSPCSDNTTQVYSFSETKDSQGKVIGCAAKVTIDLLCSKPRDGWYNDLIGSYRIQRSCEARK